MTTRTAAIIGGGVIGGGWAARFLLMGWDVRVFDPDPEAERKITEVLNNARRSLPGLSDVALPAEDMLPGEEGMCGLLERSLYGTRDAAFNWTETYTKVLCESLGFEKVEASPCTFFDRKRCLKTVVHGDDFFAEGTASDLKKLDKDALRDEE